MDICSAYLRVGYFLECWKVVDVVLASKEGRRFSIAKGLCLIFLFLVVAKGLGRYLARRLAFFVVDNWLAY